MQSVPRVVENHLIVHGRSQPRRACGSKRRWTLHFGIRHWVSPVLNTNRFVPRSRVRTATNAFYADAIANVHKCNRCSKVGWGRLVATVAKLKGTSRSRSSLSSIAVPRLGFLCLLCCLNRTRLLSRRPFSPHGIDCESENVHRSRAKADASTTKPGLCTESRHSACTDRPQCCNCRCIALPRVHECLPGRTVQLLSLCAEIISVSLATRR